MTTMMSYEEFTQLNDEATTESAASTTTTEQPPQDADTREPFEEVTMTSSSRSESYEETRIWYDGINPRGEFIERRPYHIYQDEDGQDVVRVFPVYPPTQTTTTTTTTTTLTTTSATVLARDAWTLTWTRTATRSGRSRAHTLTAWRGPATSAAPRTSPRRGTATRNS